MPTECLLSQKSNPAKIEKIDPIEAKISHKDGLLPCPRALQKSQQIIERSGSTNFIGEGFQKYSQ